MNDNSRERIDSEVLIEETSGGTLEALADPEGPAPVLPCIGPAFLAMFGASPCRRL